MDDADVRGSTDIVPLASVCAATASICEHRVENELFMGTTSCGGWSAFLLILFCALPPQALQVEAIELMSPIIPLLVGIS